jgi:hypothetical protein
MVWDFQNVILIFNYHLLVRGMTKLLNYEQAIFLTSNQKFYCVHIFSGFLIQEKSGRIKFTAQIFDCDMQTGERLSHIACKIIAEYKKKIKARKNLVKLAQILSSF